MPERTYSELITLPTFRERFEYLRLNRAVGMTTLGSDRYFGQKFYQSQEWKSIRDRVIVRDCGCDLSFEGHEVFGRILIHHMNPIRIQDIREATRFLMDPEYLICVSHYTHEAIHYGDERLLVDGLPERSPNDTCPWKH